MKLEDLIGKNVFIRTVTNYYTGKLEEIGDKELTLSSCSWIADTGRFYTTLKSGILNEVEPMPVPFVVIGRGAIVDCCEWLHNLPLEQK